MDYYEILEVHPRASQRAIERAFRDLARRIHPDVQPADKQAWAHERMTAITEAYRTLSDPKSRQEYDRRLATGTVAKPHTPTRATVARTAPVCASHPARPSTARCAQCGAGLCAECRVAMGTRVLCPRCALQDETHQRDRTGVAVPPAPDRRRSVIGRIVHGWLGIEDGWSLLSGTLLLATFTVVGSAVFTEVGVSQLALASPGSLQHNAALGYALGVLAGFTAWVGVMLLKPLQRPRIALAVLLAVGLGAWRSAVVLQRGHLTAARAAVRQGAYRRAVGEFALAEWHGEFPDLQDARREIGEAYSKLAITAERTFRTSRGPLRAPARVTVDSH